MRRLISFFALLGTYHGARLWSPVWGFNRDLAWSEIPSSTDNDGGAYILEKHYTSTWTATWILQELDVHNLTHSIANLGKHGKGDSRTRSLLAGKIRRNITIALRSAVKRKLPTQEKKFWYTNMIDRTVSEISALLTLKGNPPPPCDNHLKGGKTSISWVRKSAKEQRKRDKRFVEMEIFLGAHGRLDNDVIPTVAIGGISISEITKAIASEQGWSKN